MIDLDVAYDKLAQFQTADEVARFLVSEGVKATPGISTSCAVAVWMQDITGKNVWVSRTNFGVTDNCLITTFRQHAQAVEDFVYRFDHGEYPDLVDSYKVPGITVYYGKVL